MKPLGKKDLERAKDRFAKEGGIRTRNVQLPDYEDRVAFVNKRGREIAKRLRAIKSV